MLRCVPILFASPLSLAVAEAAADQPDEIVVRSSKLDTRLESFAGSAEVILLSGDEVGLDSAERVAERLTGVQAAVANGSQVVFQIRGIGAVDHQALTPGAAAVYRDGVLLATNVQTNFLPFDLERAEVLKGPQGTLHGRNASSGSIDFISVRPGEADASYLAAELGTLERVGLEGGIESAVADGLDMRLSGRFLQRQPGLDNVAGPAAAGGVTDSYAVRGQLRRRGAGDLLLRVHYEAQNGVNPAPRNDSLDLADHEIAVGADGLRDTNNDFYGGAAEYSRSIGAWDLFSLTAYEGYEQRYGFDFDGTPAPFGDPTLNANLAYDRSFDQFSEELRLSGAGAGGTFVIGTQLSFDRFAQDYLIWCGELDQTSLVGSCNYVGAPGRVGPTPASNTPAASLLTVIEQERAVAALFGQYDIDLSRHVGLTLGLRTTYEDIRGEGAGFHIFRDASRALNDRDGLGGARGSNRIEELFLDGNVALDIKLSERSLAYVSIGTGRKSGGFNGEVANNALHFRDEGLFGPERVVAYELGARAELPFATNLSAALFYQDYDDPQARIFVEFEQPGAETIISNSLSNLDAAEVYGFEGSLETQPLDGLTLRAGLTLLETRIMEGGDATGNAELFDGNPLPFASDVSAVFGMRYEKRLAGGRRLSLEAQGKYRSDFQLDAEGRDDRMQEGYTNLDGAATLSLREGTDVALWVRNALDVDAAISGYGFIGTNTFRSDPRTVGLRLTRRWR